MNGTAPDSVEVRVLGVAQPIGAFYVGIMKARDLRDIAFADTRRQTQREIELYSGIQRELSDKRCTEIKQYIESFDAAFPNSFIIAVNSEDVLKEENGALLIRRHERVASIIDGQHRLAGFDDKNSENFDLIVSIFVDLPIEDQAMLFATINIKQTRVNPSLVYDLFAETTPRSPQKTCHNISKSLNAEKDSPLFHRIKPLGKRTEEYVGTLTQATVVKRLLPLICRNPDAVRDIIKRGRKPDPNDAVNADRVFWKFFSEEKDWAILKVMLNYFAAVAESFSEDWASSESPLSRTIGYSTLMRLLEPLVRLGLAIKPEPRLDKEFFRNHVEKAKSLAPFRFEQYPASGAGETKLFNALDAAVFPSTEHTRS